MRNKKKVLGVVLTMMLVVASVGFVFPAKDAFAANVTDVVVRCYSESTGDYVVDNTLTGTVTGTNQTIPAASISIDDYWPMNGGATPGNGYDIVVEYSFAFCDSASDAENAMAANNGQDSTTGMPIPKYTGPATITIPVKDGYVGTDAVITDYPSEVTISNITTTEHSITFTTDEIGLSYFSIGVELKFESNASSGSSGGSDSGGDTGSTDSSSTGTTDDSSAGTTDSSGDNSGENKDDATASDNTSNQSGESTTPQTTTDTTATPATTLTEAQQAAANAMAAAVVPASVVAPSGSGVTIVGYAAITDDSVNESLYNLATNIETLNGNQGNVNILSLQKFELNASGKGRVVINIGTAFVGKVAIVAHLHNGQWTMQQVIVKEDGTIDPYFESFSPIAVMVTNQTSTIAALATNEPGVAKAAAPKTGEGNYLYIVFILGVLASGALIAGYRIRKY
ncbi:MAG: LPXTG cell wall anchor domain-containing protein [Lachnospiraceae bacterium]|nr:LPXTG cell wall anchor domain-containing protein [Lachnospiraceae bacterium]